MIRMQLYLPDDLKLKLDHIAQREDKPTAKIIREVLQAGLEKKRKKNAGDTLMELVKLAHTVPGKGPKDLSTNFFDYAYGKKSSFAKRR